MTIWESWSGYECERIAFSYAFPKLTCGSDTQVEGIRAATVEPLTCFCQGLVPTPCQRTRAIEMSSLTGHYDGAAVSDTIMFQAVSRRITTGCCQSCGNINPLGKDRGSVSQPSQPSQTVAPQCKYKTTQLVGSENASVYQAIVMESNVSKRPLRVGGGC